MTSIYSSRMCTTYVIQGIWNSGLPLRITRRENLRLLFTAGGEIASLNIALHLHLKPQTPGIIIISSAFSSFVFKLFTLWCALNKSIMDVYFLLKITTALKAFDYSIVLINNSCIFVNLDDFSAFLQYSKILRISYEKNEIIWYGPVISQTFPQVKML